MPLTLAPLNPGTLNLEPFGASVSYLLQEDGAGHVLLEDLSGAIILEISGTGLSLTPIAPGTLTLTPDPTT